MDSCCIGPLGPGGAVRATFSSAHRPLDAISCSRTSLLMPRHSDQLGMLYAWPHGCTRCGSRMEQVSTDSRVKKPPSAKQA